MAEKDIRQCYQCGQGWRLQYLCQERQIGLEKIEKGLNKNSSFNYYGLLWRGHSVAGRASLPLGQGRGEPPGKLQGAPGKK